MIVINSNKTAPWQAALINAITDPKELLTLLELDDHLLKGATAASKLFPLKVPRGFLSRIEKGNPHDPLLKQILPLLNEEDIVEGYYQDPLQESNANPLPGLLHKYQGRVLVTLTGTCSVNCRFCFRRHFPYSANNPGAEGWEKTLEYIATDPSITEVILSGGDPLIANEQILFNFTNQLNQIAHVKRLRIHSRVPIFLPERITPEFLQWVQQLKQKLIFVLHCNHPHEINDSVGSALQQLDQNKVTLLNQSVLLKGVNDHADTLVELSEKLFDHNIQPYYLHILDKTSGTAHFDIPLDEARQLHQEMNQRLPGYLVPKLVSEQPGAPAKMGVQGLNLYTG